MKPSSRWFARRSACFPCTPSRISAGLANLLARAWEESPDTELTQRLSCTPRVRFGCRGTNCFREMIWQGEEFRRQYPQPRLRTEQVYQFRFLTGASPTTR